MSKRKHTSKAPVGDFVFIANKVFSGDCTLSLAERTVALFVAKCIGGKGSYALSYGFIATRTSVDVRTVGRALKKLCDGPEPWFARRATGQQFKERMRKVYTFTVVRNVERFVAARDKYRRERVERQAVVLGRPGRGNPALSEAELEISNRLHERKRDINAMLGRIPDADLQNKLTAAEADAQRELRGLRGDGTPKPKPRRNDDVDVDSFATVRTPKRKPPKRKPPAPDYTGKRFLSGRTVSAEN